jgi:hypothetical protein
MNLVNELQTSAEQDDVLTVLRKTKRLASKLDRQDMASWLQAEQQGYVGECANVPVPDYRKIGTMLAYNTNGYVPAGLGMAVRGIEDLPDMGLTFPIDVRESISTVLSWIEGEERGQGVYQPVPQGSDYAQTIRKYVRFNPMVAGQVSFMLHLNGSHIKAIPERIKDKVLEWACALEQAGVTGDGMSFSAKEKQIAHSVTFNINNSNIEQLTNTGMNQKGPK